MAVRLAPLVLFGCSASSPAVDEPARGQPELQVRAVIRTCVALAEPVAAPSGTKEVQPPAGSPAPIVGLSKDVIQGLVRKNLPAIRRCYERELVKRPDLAGKTRASFTIGQEGKVTSAQASGFDRAVDACVAGVIAKIQFPRPFGGGLVNVNYPFIFQQSGGAAPPPQSPPAEPEIEAPVGALRAPSCRAVAPPPELVAIQAALDRCAHPALRNRIDLEVTLGLTARVTGDEPARGCVERALAPVAGVTPATSCTIAIGHPSEMTGQAPAAGTETSCPASLR